jgi:Sec-independent protein translocase protein TatA
MPLRKRVIGSFQKVEIMEFLGIGPLELILILVLALVIFGPKDIEKAGKTIGKNLNKFIRSDTWRTINQTSQELKNLPTRLMRDAGLEDIQASVKKELSTTENTIRQSVSPNPANASSPGSLENPPDSAEGKPANSPDVKISEK